MKREFKIGDRVKALKETDGRTEIVGKEGTVIEVSTNNWAKGSGGWISVQFDEYIDGHSLDGKGKYGYCWNCYGDSLELLSKEEVIFDTSNKKTILKSNGKTYTCQCDKYDIFDKEKGVLLCLAKAHNYHYDDIERLVKGAEEIMPSKFNVGDLVFVEDRGESYTTYEDWFNLYGSKLKEIYMKTRELPAKLRNQYKIVAKGKHEDFAKMLYAIQDLDGNVYLIDEKGLMK